MTKKHLLPTIYTPTAYRVLFLLLWLFCLEGCEGQGSAPSSSATSTVTQDTVSRKTIGFTSDTSKLVLVPMKQKDIFDHYINKKYENNQVTIQIFDGVEEKEIVFKPKIGELRMTEVYLPAEWIEISENQRYFTVRRTIPRTDTSEQKYQVELRDLSNTIIAQGEFAPIGDLAEAEDNFIPFENGKGMSQNCNGFLSEPIFVIYSIENQVFRKTFGYERFDCSGGYKIVEESKYVIVAFTTSDANRLNSVSIEKYEVNGRLIWRKKLAGKTMRRFIASEFDGTVGTILFDPSKPEDKWNYYIFNSEGVIKKSVTLPKKGNWDGVFQLYNGSQYLILPQGGNIIMLFDLDNECSFQEFTCATQSHLRFPVLYNEKLIFSSFTSPYVGSPEELHKWSILEVLNILDNGNQSIVYEEFPISSSGSFEVFQVNNQLFAKEKPNYYAKNRINSKYFKIVKL